MPIELAHAAPVIQHFIHHRFGPVAFTVPSLFASNTAFLPLLDTVLKENVTGGTLLIGEHSFQWAVIHDHFQQTAALRLIRESQYTVEHAWLEGGHQGRVTVLGEW